MKRTVTLSLALLFLVLALAGCGKYVSSYSAVMHVRHNDSDSAWTSFHEYRGTDVFTLKFGGETAKIRYTGTLETGSLTVYYDRGDAKEVLFTAKAGEEIDACSEPFSAETVYVILETDETCKDGNFSFEIVRD